MNHLKAMDFPNNIVIVSCYGVCLLEFFVLSFSFEKSCFVFLFHVTIPFPVHRVCFVQWFWPLKYVYLLYDFCMRPTSDLLKLNKELAMKSRSQSTQSTQSIYLECYYMKLLHRTHHLKKGKTVNKRMGTSTEMQFYRQTIGIPMGTNCAFLVANLFLFCYERDFMKSLSRENQADIIEAFNST